MFDSPHMHSAPSPQILRFDSIMPSVFLGFTPLCLLCNDKSPFTLL